MPVKLSAHISQKGLDIPPASKGEDHTYLCEGAGLMQSEDTEEWCAKWGHSPLHYTVPDVPPKMCGGSIA